MRDHLGVHSQHLGVAARMIVVLVGVQHILDGLVGHRPQLFEDLVVIAVEHIVHQDHALIGHLHRDVPRAHALGHADDIQIVLQLLNADGRRRRVLRVGEPGATEQQAQGGTANEESSGACGALYHIFRILLSYALVPLPASVRCRVGLGSAARLGAKEQSECPVAHRDHGALFAGERRRRKASKAWTTRSARCRRSSPCASARTWLSLASNCRSD